MCVCAREREKLVLTWQADGRLHSTLTQAWTHIRSSGSVYASDHLTAPTTAQTHLTTTITKTLRFTCECNKCSVIKPVELIIRMMCECIYSYDNQGLTRGTKKGESWTTSKLEGRLNSCFRQHCLCSLHIKRSRHPPLGLFVQFILILLIALYACGFAVQMRSVVLWVNWYHSTSWFGGSLSLIMEVWTLVQKHALEKSYLVFFSSNQ